MLQMKYIYMAIFSAICIFSFISISQKILSNNAVTLVVDLKWMWMGETQN